MDNNLIEIDGVVINIYDLKHKKGRKSKSDLELLEKIKLKQIELGCYQEEPIKIAKKKGRKPKVINPDDVEVKKTPKKRGRKPKGGKIVNINDINKNVNVFKSNIILHLKCSSSDLVKTQNFIGDLNYDPNVENIQPFNGAIDDSISFINETLNQPLHNCELNLIDYNKKEEHNETKYIIEIKDIEHNETKCCNKENSNNIKEIWNKLKNLQYKLKHNQITDKKSVCFWCTYGFDNLPIYIPKCYLNENYEVYGCFCSPECACSYLFNEKIDASTKWERYSLLNSIYSSIYNYSKNIKPAPDPHYLLDKYFGDLSIDEYRKLTQTDNLLLVVDKPITKVLPEIHDESNELPNINCNSYGSNTNNVSQKKYRLARNKPVTTHNNANTNWTT
jgi:hypothetical protein